MAISTDELKLNELRTKHPRFIYHDFRMVRHSEAIHFEHCFELEPNIFFRPTVQINVPEETSSRLDTRVLNNLAFHLGLMEIPSYWKAACSPTIEVRAGPMDDFQARWWESLLLRGMGEFFYINRIDFTAKDFVSIRPASDVSPEFSLHIDEQRPGSVLVPMGGGKDSAVTGEIVKRVGDTGECWALNPTKATVEVVRRSGSGRFLTAKRTIDPVLLELNECGYLNGHTPFSAYLGFLSVATALLGGHRMVAVSNERSSNEGNVWFHGVEVNHQYSKSFEFERSFREYVRRFITKGVDYFSVLRPLYELQIGGLFARYEQYHDVFRSCNRGQNQGIWCNRCPKCLFAYTLLYPFLGGDYLKRVVFGDDLLARGELAGLALELLGVTAVKPFECVGTREETAAAFGLGAARAEVEEGRLPVVLEAVRQALGGRYPDSGATWEFVRRSWTDEHSVPREYIAVVKSELARGS